MNEDFIIQKIIKLEEEVAEIKHQIATRLATKDDISTILAGQDKMIQILLCVDQERTFTNACIDRIEEDVKNIKLRLQIT